MASPAAVAPSRTEKSMRGIMKMGFVLIALTQLLVSESVIKIWSIDLSHDEDFRRRVRASEVNLRPPTIDFLKEDKIIVAFDDDVLMVPDSEKRPAGFHALEVEATSGKTGRKISSEALASGSRVAVTGDSNFLMLAGEQLKKFSSSFNELASLPTPLRVHGQPTQQRIGERIYLNPRYETWDVDVAPGGREFVLAHVKNPSEMEVSWLKTNDFTTITMIEAAPSNQQGMSAGNQGVWLFPFGWAKLVLSSGQEASLCNRCFRGYFLTDELVFLDEGERFQVKTISGVSKGQGKLQSGASKFCRATHATRFAYATGQYRGSGFPVRTRFASHMDVKVFDWSTMKQVGEIAFDEPEKPVSAGFKQSAIALSPDGTQLAVLTGSILNLYRLQQ
jgi:hypothetical protein